MNEVQGFADDVAESLADLDRARTARVLRITAKLWEIDAALFALPSLGRRNGRRSAWPKTNGDSLPVPVVLADSSQSVLGLPWGWCL
jgi:hypothetical protein